MKLYRNLSEAVIQGLQSIFTDNKYADKVIEKILKSNPKWGARDRRFIAETIYDIVRWHRLFKEIAETSAPKSNKANVLMPFEVTSMLSGIVANFGMIIT